MKKPFTLWLLFAAVMFALGGCGSTPAQSSAGETIDDAIITTKVKSAFVGDQKVSALHISVETNRGVVTLTGTAKDVQESRQAVALAQHIPGVKRVDNRIAVR
jgi:osmotically-inducible protein OsmY